MNTEHKDCPFCLDNKLLKSRIVAGTDGGFLIENVTSPGCYLIIPKLHAEALQELPDTWWKDFKELLAQIPNLSDQYNLSLNYGVHAGQTVKHLHFWIIPRYAEHPSAGKGLASLISEANQE